MKLTQKDLDHVKKLAHMAIKPEKEHQYLQNMQNILDYMDILNQMPLEDLDPSAYANARDQKLREDKVIDYGDLNLEKNAPAWEGTSFKVPQMRSDA
tara:strand:- start:136 stop:426 length:291 start_codon:yes stop_codon:yes gene_type:complete